MHLVGEGQYFELKILCFNRRTGSSPVSRTTRPATVVCPPPRLFSLAQ